MMKNKSLYIINVNKTWRNIIPDDGIVGYQHFSLRRFHPDKLIAASSFSTLFLAKSASRKNVGNMMLHRKIYDGSFLHNVSQFLRIIANELQARRSSEWFMLKNPINFHFFLKLAI